jgi:hypothetical protein
MSLSGAVLLCMYNTGSVVFVKHNRIKQVINKLLYEHKLSHMFRPLLGHLQAVERRSITKVESFTPTYRDPFGNVYIRL